MPYSEYNKFVFLANGLGSRRICFRTVLHTSLSKTPTKNVIYKQKLLNLQLIEGIYKCTTYCM